MESRGIKTAAHLTAAMWFAASAGFAQMGRTWPSEKKIVPDPVTGLPLTFLTSSDTYHQSKIYQTHRQWTSDGKWLVFRGQRETGSQAFAVNEETGLIVQVTETGFSGMLCLSNKAMKLYVLAGGGRGANAGEPRQILEIDLAKLFADVEAKTVKPAASYTRVCGTIPAALQRMATWASMLMTITCTSAFEGRKPRNSLPVRASSRDSGRASARPPAVCAA